ncbi:hypothetical protein BJ170DRAFT_487023 [Xylariales sp. AK1849]|nr:hypothetical protein BJ170DRAFT_487023 [Xylariales sp. AK1849]
MWSFGTTMTMANDREPTATPATKPPVDTPQTENIQALSARPDTRSPILSQRSLRQMSIFFAGAGFLSLSIFITRRSVARKQMATIPRFYQPSNRPVSKISSDSSLIAFEALNLATLNVVGFGIMATGGLSWAFDISTIGDLRKLARKHIGPEGGNADEEAEREVEEWIASVLTRKGKEKEQDTKSSHEAK